MRLSAFFGRMMAHGARRWAGDIRTWIAVLFLIRLAGLTYPPVEVYHNWRQTGTLMGVRAMHQHGPDLCHPRTAIAGHDRPKEVGSEFPLYNACIYLLDRAFGQADWHGRLVSLAAGSLGLWWFYLLVGYFRRNLAFPAALVLGCSLWFMFGRKIMPDVFSASLVLGGLLAGARYVLNGGWWWPVYVAGCTAGLLSKMPSAALMVLLFPLALQPSVPRRRQVALVAGALVAVACMCGWYFVHVPALIAAGGYQLYWPRDLWTGWSEALARWPDTVHRILFTSLYAYSAFALLLVGMRGVWEMGRAWRLAMGAGVLVLLLFIGKTGDAFPEQDYYMIPFVPLMAIAVAAGIRRAAGWGVPAALLCVLCAGEGVLNQQHDLRWPQEMAYKTRLKEDLDPLLQPGEPVVCISDLNPSDLYFSGREGWLVSPEDTLALRDTRRYRRAGARYAVVNIHRTWHATFRPGWAYQGRFGHWDVYRLPD